MDSIFKNYNVSPLDDGGEVVGTALGAMTYSAEFALF
jgi:hypothetical protein